MTTKLTIKAKEGSTFGIRADFIEKMSDDQDGFPITPNDDLTWSLSEKDGTPVNERIDVPLVSAQSVIIVLSGDDLALPAGYPVRRYLTIEGTYNSILGDNLKLKDEVSFQIFNLVGES